MKILHSQHPACLRSRTTWDWMCSFGRADSCASNAYLVEGWWLLVQVKRCTNLFWQCLAEKITFSDSLTWVYRATPHHASARKSCSDVARKKLRVDRHERGYITC